MLVERRVYREDVRFCKQRVEIDLIIPFLGSGAGGGVIDDSSSESFGYTGDPPSDGAESDDSPGHFRELFKRLRKMREDRALLVGSALDIFIIVRKFFQQIKEYGKGVLGNGIRRITGDISPLDPPFIQIVSVQDVDTGRGHTDQLGMSGF